MKTLTWLFNDNNLNPSALEDSNQLAHVKPVSPPGAGYVSLMIMVPATSGWWDLGPGGLIEVGIASAPVVIASVRYFGGTGLYGVGPVITLNGSNPDSFSETSEAGKTSSLAVFALVTRRCVWNLGVPPLYPLANLIVASPPNGPRDAAIDSIIIETGDASEAAVSTLKAQLRPVRDQSAQVVASLDAILSA